MALGVLIGPQSALSSVVTAHLGWHGALPRPRRRADGERDATARRRPDELSAGSTNGQASPPALIERDRRDGLTVRLPTNTTTGNVTSPHKCPLAHKRGKLWLVRELSISGMAVDTMRRRSGSRPTAHACRNAAMALGTSPAPRPTRPARRHGLVEVASVPRLPPPRRATIG